MSKQVRNSNRINVSKINFSINLITVIKLIKKLFCKKWKIYIANQ